MRLVNQSTMSVVTRFSTESLHATSPRLLSRRKRSTRLKQLHFEREGDYADIISLDPSYTNYILPYRVNCADRYSQSKRKYQRQFRHEINHLIANQPTAVEAATFHRYMSYTTLWPPMHNRREIENLHTYFPKPSPRRISYLMTNVIS